MIDTNKKFNEALSVKKAEGVRIDKSVIVSIIATIVELIGLAKSYPLIMISLGHEIGVDPGVTNISNRFNPNRFTSEVSLIRRVYSVITSFIGQKFRKSIVILPDVSLAYTIAAINKIVANRGNNRDLAIELHTDIDNGHNTDEILLVYASSNGKKQAESLEEAIFKANPKRKVIIRHSSTGFVSRPGFLYKTSCPALIVELGCINSSADEVHALSADIYQALNLLTIK